ncbi:MAG: adenylyltransferase/cytidyltransferase family protein, partial [Desulfobacterales bacterium]
MNTIDKILTLESLVTRLKKVRKAAKKIVFTNGCFDILHVGHVRYLAEARSRGDILIVGLNSDASVSLIKG